MMGFFDKLKRANRNVRPLQFVEKALFRVEM